MEGNVIPAPARNFPIKPVDGKLQYHKIVAIVDPAQLLEVKLKNRNIRKPYRFYIHRNNVVTDFRAAGLIRASREYKKFTSNIIKTSIREHFGIEEEIVEQIEVKEESKEEIVEKEPENKIPEQSFYSYIVSFLPFR